MNKKYKIVESPSYNPFITATDTENDMIEEYFRIEEENPVKVAEDVVEEEKEVKKIVKEPGSTIDIDDCSVFLKPTKAPEKNQKKSVLSDEWLVVE